MCWHVALMFMQPVKIITCSWIAQHLWMHHHQDDQLKVCSCVCACVCVFSLNGRWRGQSIVNEVWFWLHLMRTIIWSFEVTTRKLLLNTKYTIIICHFVSKLNLYRFRFILMAKISISTRYSLFHCRTAHESCEMNKHFCVVFFKKTNIILSSQTVFLHKWIKSTKLIGCQSQFCEATVVVSELHYWTSWVEVQPTQTGRRVDTHKCKWCHRSEFVVLFLCVLFNKCLMIRIYCKRQKCIFKSCSFEGFAVSLKKNKALFFPCYFLYICQTRLMEEVAAR